MQSRGTERGRNWINWSAENMINELIKHSIYFNATVFQNIQGEKTQYLILSLITVS